MNTLKYLGLNSEKVAPVVKALSQLLADYQVFYANLRGFHWNVRGKGFFMLHEHYENLYNDTANKVDEVAEPTSDNNPSALLYESRSSIYFIGAAWWFTSNTFCVKPRYNVCNIGS